MALSLIDYLTALDQPSNINTLTQMGRGIEREGLRVLPKGKLSTEPHRFELGSALTHPFITTDYSETLLEFITPVNTDANVTLSQLRDIQKYVFEHIDGELLWPLSMPCFVDDANEIPLAQYGTSNIGKMKTVYRQGLKNRYGSMMQVIAGIHFNFSFSKEFWLVIQKASNNNDPIDDFISARYFALIRNYKRFCWLIPYLYGASPLICRSFLQNAPEKLPFKTSDNGYLYLEYATSLRMSDLGYTNSAQSSLKICYNNIETYVEGVENAISLVSEDFEKIGVKVDGEYRQLNGNILQIENELYAPIRPKRVANSGEKPSQALKSRGVEYIEVRALDINPFVDTGISIEQVNFLDIFLTYCALAPSQQLDCDSQSPYESNMDEVVLRGRDPNLLLVDGKEQKSIKQWGNELFDEFDQTAKLLDKANNCHHYSEAANRERSKINNSDLTYSAQLLDLVVNQNKSLTQMALSNAQSYRDQQVSSEYQYFTKDEFDISVKKSHEEQKAVENSDVLGFDEFLYEYFKTP